MSVNTALFDRLSTFSALTALVSTRVYPELRTQGATQPTVTIHEISGNPAHAMGSDPGLTRLRFQISSWAETYNDARAVARQVGTALSRWSDGDLGVQACWLDNEVSLFDETHRLHQIAQDFIVVFVGQVGFL